MTNFSFVYLSGTLAMLGICTLDISIRVTLLMFLADKNCHLVINLEP